MPLFLTLFASGFEEIIPAAVEIETGCAVRLVRSSSGLALLEINGVRDPSDIAALPFLSNAFLVFKTFDGTPSFDTMVAKTRGLTITIPSTTDSSFRVRFSRANQFEGVPKTVRNAAERQITDATGLLLDREGDGLEFWYILRSEGGGYYGLRLPQAKTVSPERGELRPDLAALIVRWAGVSSGMSVLDPFAGSGALPLAATNAAASVRVFASDIDADAVARLKTRLPGADVFQADACNLTCIADRSISAVITDPPWGVYDETLAPALAELYKKALAECRRVLCENGFAVFLTVRDFDLSAAAGGCGFTVTRRLDILVGGRKATLHHLV